MRVGFIGLGAMGAGVAANLVRANLAVTVLDVRPEAVEQLTTLGASAAQTPAEVARVSDVIGVCVRGDETVLGVIEGPDGVLAGARPGSIVLIHSTVHPDTCRRAEAACRERGVTLLDVDMSGFPMKAASGELTLLIGGDERALPRIEPYLRAIGQQWFHLGPVGSGSVAKHANNVMYLLAAVGVFEGLNVARANGLNLDRMVEAAMVSSGNSEALRLWRDHGALQRGRADGFKGLGPPAAEILRTSVQVARLNGVNLPVTSAILDLVDAVPTGAGS